MFVNNSSFFGKYGGSYVSDSILNELKKIKRVYRNIILNRKFIKEYYLKLCELSNRPTPLYKANNFKKKFGSNFFFKREDLNFTGSHKINNVLGQILLAKKLKKKIIIAETGAGQHGIAVSSICALYGMKCKIFMGKKDAKKQRLNVLKIKKMGAKIVIVKEGKKTLKEAINSAIRFWSENFNKCYYLIGSVVGPAPYPEIVRNFQSIIGKEIKNQTSNIDYIVACIGGGSNSIGIFFDFLNKNIKLIGVEAGGKDKFSNSFSTKYGKNGILHGCKTIVMTDKNGNVSDAKSISSGLRYPAIGPEHAYLKKKKLVKYSSVKDNKAIEAFNICSKLEGIIPSYESSHAIAYAIKISKKKKNTNILVNLSGRGEKDING
ncbi:tryptophan synthase subunit beta [Candidatus Vidania fulgoroideorum]